MIPKSVKHLALLFVVLLASNQAISQVCDLSISEQRKTQVTTMSAPFSYVVHVEMKRGRTYSGTAFFIHPRVLLTAGHNLRKRPQFIFTRVKALTLRFGATNETTNLYQTHIVTTQNDNIYTLDSFNRDYSIAEDYGIIILPDETAYHKCGNGIFNLTVFNPANTSQAINIAGYPGNEPLRTQWTDKTNNYKFDGECIRYDFSTEHGVSGAPIWYDQGDKHNVFAIHTNGGTGSNQNQCNTATVITQTIYNDIVKFCTSKGITIAPAD